MILREYDMTKMTITLRPFPSKNLEFAQTMESLIKELSKEPGCLNYRFQREEENKFSLDSSWSTRGKLEAHFQSPLFNILLGAFHALCERPQVKITDGARTLGMEAIEAARK